MRSVDDWLAVLAFFNRPQLLRLLFVNRFVCALIEQHFGQRPYGYGILRLILAWDENKRYNGTEEDECLIGMAICDRRSESLEQENRQYSQAPPDNIIRYEWDLGDESGNRRCVQLFKDGAHEHCAEDWRLTAPGTEYYGRAFEHRPHLAADEAMKISQGNSEYRAARELHCNWVVKELYENDFRRAGTNSELTTAVRIALSDIDIIHSHLTPSYVRLFRADFSMLTYLAKCAWKKDSSSINSSPMDRKRQIAIKISHLLEHFATIDEIFGEAKVTLPLAPLGHIFGHASSSGNASWCRILQLLSQCAELRLTYLSDDDPEIMSAMRTWPNVLLHNWPITLHKLDLDIDPEDYDRFGEEFWLEQIAQLLHNTNYGDLRHCRPKTIKLSLDRWWYRYSTKLGHFVQSIIERLYQDFMSSSSASSSAQQTDQLSATNDIFYKCVLDINVSWRDRDTWHQFLRIPALFLPKTMWQPTLQQHSSPPTYHFLNKSGEHWRLQCSTQFTWKWKIWCYSSRAEHNPLDVKLEERDQCMRRWWAKCEQLSSSTMFGHDNFDPMMVYDDRTRIRVISREEK